MKIIADNKTHDLHPQVLLTLAGMTFIITLLICVAFNFGAMGLSYTYTINEQNSIAGFKPEAIQVQNYLYCPTKSVISPLTGHLTTTFAFGYLTIYHCLMNTFKIISIKETEINQPFSIVNLIAKFFMLVLVMAFISVTGCAFNNIKFASYLDTFNGLDSFSFALMMIAIVMFIFGILGFIKRFKTKK